MVGLVDRRVPAGHAAVRPRHRAGEATKAAVHASASPTLAGSQPTRDGCGARRQSLVAPRRRRPCVGAGRSRIRLTGQQSRRRRAAVPAVEADGRRSAGALSSSRSTAASTRRVSQCYSQRGSTAAEERMRQESRPPASGDAPVRLVQRKQRMRMRRITRSSAGRGSRCAWSTSDAAQPTPARRRYYEGGAPSFDRARGATESDSGR